jgi:urocanate hydratase
MLAFQDGGAVVFEYGNAIREQAARAGLESANGFRGFVQLYIRPSFCIGRGPCRWVALSGDPQDIRAIDEALLTEFAQDTSVTSWIAIAMEHVPHQGLPARTSWLDYTQRVRFGTMVNRMVAEGAVSAPVAMTRDHLDSGAVAQPTRETEGMLDGSDAIADWPVLNALLNTAGGADLVALHQGAGSGMGGSISAGVTLIIDGTAEAGAKIERVLRTDPGIGVIRHADAGYESSQALVESSDLVAPMLGRDR